MRRIAKLWPAVLLLVLAGCTEPTSDGTSAPSTPVSADPCAAPDILSGPIGTDGVGPTYQPPADVHKVTFGTPCGYFQAEFPTAASQSSVLETTLKDDDGRPTKDYHTILNNYQLQGQPVACPQCEEFSVFVHPETSPGSSLESYAQDCSNKADYQHLHVNTFNHTGEPAFMANCRPFGSSGLTRQLAILRHQAPDGTLFRYEVMATGTAADVLAFVNSFQLNS
ncbi:MAG TPA: hypothetical protein VLI05_01065 [Candidatus Saccharimonadia bacterium]|nr:hypothetical protein [Candidatus Saccharimonadia bacterium]